MATTTAKRSPPRALYRKVEHFLWHFLGVGISAGAVLATLSTLLMLVSLFLVGSAGNGSMRAALLGISWNDIVGFEVGLLAIVIVGVAFSAAFVSIYDLSLRLVIGQARVQAQQSRSHPRSVRPWAFRLLVGCFVLPAAFLLVLSAFVDPDSKTVSTVQVPQAQVQPVNMGSAINTPFREAEPSFTADGSTMYFNCNNADICVSRLEGTWEEGKWTPPESLGAPVNTGYEEVEPVINGAGDELYFTSRRPQGSLRNVPIPSPFMDFLTVANALSGSKRSSTSLSLGGLGLNDIWVSHKTNEGWSEPQNLSDIPGEPPVNSAYSDHCLYFSADGNEAFWTSTRPGGYGGDDIWTSRRVNGEWSAPENLGPNVNTAGDEHMSIPTPDGKSLYVTSSRAGGFGNEDIYITTRDFDGKWGELVNLGSLVNGPGDDRCPAWTPDLKIFLFDSVRKGGFGGRDIWWVNFKDVTGYPSA